MTPVQWRLARQVEAIVTRDIARSDGELARMLGVPVSDLKPVLGALYGMGRVDFCRGYVVLPAPAQATRRAA